MDYNDLIADLEANVADRKADTAAFEEMLAPLLKSPDGAEELLHISARSLALCLTLALEVNALQDFLIEKIDDLERLAITAGFKRPAQIPSRPPKDADWSYPNPRLTP